MHQIDRAGANTEATDEAITASPCGLDNVYPLGDQTLNQQSQTSQAGSEDINEQPQQSPAAIHQQPKAGPAGGNDIDDRPQNGPAADFDDFGVRGANLV